MSPSRSAAFAPLALLTRNVKLLLAARTARSVGQGAMVVSFALYLHALGYGGTAIGLVLMAGLLFGALLTLIVGPMSDHRGRRGLLLLYETAAAFAALAAMVAHNEVVLIVAATIAGFGRGGNGAAGPFSPVEQAWLAREVSGPLRRHVFALNATSGFLGMAAGSALAAVPSVVGHGFADIEAYRRLFWIPVAGSLVAMVLLAAAREAATGPGMDRDERSEVELVRHENRQLQRLAITNAVNGLGIGIIGPLIAYWFALRFGRGPGMIGPALAASFLLGACGSVISGSLSVRFGAVRSVVWMRLVGLLLLLSVPFAESFGLAAAAYALRGAFNRGTIGARQSVAVELTRAERRGLAASVQSLSLQIPRAIGPILGGWMIHAGQLVAPFLLAATLQAAYVVLYRRFFGVLDRLQRTEA